MKKVIQVIILIFLIQSCINQKVTQNDIFNPTKEFELSKNFNFERDFISHSDTIRIEYWYMSEKEAELNIIYFSGNGSNIRSAIPFFNELGNQFNLNIFSINYSGYGLSHGNPSIDGIVEDGKIALDYFDRNLNNDHLPTILLGYSLGGFVALNLMNHNIVDQGVIMSTFSSLEDLQQYLLKEALPAIIRPFLKLDIDTTIYKLDNKSLVELTTKPILYIHGEKDDFIPSSMSYNLYNLSLSPQKSIKIIDDADHRTILKDSIYNKKVISEIKTFFLN